MVSKPDVFSQKELLGLISRFARSDCSSVFFITQTGKNSYPNGSADDNLGKKFYPNG